MLNDENDKRVTDEYSVSAENEEVDWEGGVELESQGVAARLMLMMIRSVGLLVDLDFCANEC